MYVGSIIGITKFSTGAATSYGGSSQKPDYVVLPGMPIKVQIPTLTYC
jgi:hypothetical protein